MREYYSLNFALLYHHKIDFRIFEDMVPWEKSVYVGLLVKKVKEEEELSKLRELEKRSKRRR